jgi:hypothetical protein
MVTFGKSKKPSSKPRSAITEFFAIGVGSAPAESLLKDLAEQTGGACELVTPSESISEAVLRMTQRIRSARTSSIAIHWEGGEVLWQSKLPKQVFSDETIHVHARLTANEQTHGDPHTALDGRKRLEWKRSRTFDATGIQRGHCLEWLRGQKSPASRDEKAAEEAGS